MTCDVIRKNIARYVDNELWEEENIARIEAHMNGCASCRAERDALLSIKHRVAGSRYAAPAGLAARVLTAHRKGAQGSTIRTALPLFSAAGIAAAAALLVGALNFTAPRRVSPVTGYLLGSVSIAEAACLDGTIAITKQGYK